jgi:hypothetical protein
MEIDIDDKIIREKYDEWMERLANHEEQYINTKYFQVRDDSGYLVDPTMMIQLIVSLIVEHTEAITIEPTITHQLTKKI